MSAAAGRINRFALWITVAVIVVLAGAAVLVVALNHKPTSTASAAPTAEPTGSIINTATGAISFGTGSHTMDTYIDFMCPICNGFEQLYGTDVQNLVVAGTITLRVHPIAILDRSSQGTQYSSRAASAMYAVAAADPADAYSFLQALFANQPQEGSTGLTDAQILQVAKEAGVHITANLEKAITSHAYVAYVQRLTPKTPLAPGETGIGTPTIAVDGTTIALSQLPKNPSDVGTLFH